jgi:uncharacterized membrane protein
MTATTTIVLLWLGFAGSHLLLSSLPVRRRIIARIGEDAFRGLYSLVAFAWFVPLVWVYFAHKHTGPALWNPEVGPALRWLVYLVMGTSLVLLASSFIQPSPAAVLPGAAKARGVLLLTRHPLLMSLALFGLAHLIPNGFASDVAFFGGFLLFVLVGAWHQDQRKLATDPTFREFHASTPFLPFTGRDTLRGLRELPLGAVAAGIGLAVLLRWFHGDLFGG